MTATLPLDILHKVERRWSARIRQTETFPTRADRLKRDSATFIEGVQQPQPSDGTTEPLTPSVPAHEE